MSESGEKDLSQERSKQKIRHIPPDGMELMNRQLATLLQAGMPMNESLNTVAAQSEYLYLRDIIQQARRKILSGVVSLAEAFEKGPDVFPKWYIEMLRAGEQDHKLEEALKEASERFGKEVPGYMLRLRLRNALIAILALLGLWLLWRYGLRTPPR